MRRVLRIAMFSLGMLILLLGLVSLADRPLALPEVAPTVISASATPLSAPPAISTTSSTQSEPIPFPTPLSVPPVITGRVVSLDGEPVGGALVYTSDGETTTFSPLYEHILVVGAGEATLSKYLLPGSDTGAVSPELLPVE